LLLQVGFKNAGSNIIDFFEKASAVITSLNGFKPTLTYWHS
jgi:hypothetical protein